MSEVSCDGCMEAITCSRAKRGMSDSATTCACSMRSRRSRGPFAFAAASKASSATRFARSPMAWKFSWKPALSRSMAKARIFSGSIVIIPLVEESSEYGVSIAAVRDPKAPSVTSLSAPVRNHGSVVPPSRRICSSCSIGAEKGSHSVMRTVSLPSFLIAR